MWMVLQTASMKDNLVYIDPLNELEVFVEFYNPEQPTFAQIAQESKDLVDAGLLDQMGALQRVWVETGLKSQEEVDKMYAMIIGTQTPEEKMIDEEVKEVESEEVIEEDTEEVEEE